MAERMRFMRERLGYKRSAEFARFLGVSPQRWNQVETGAEPLSRQLAQLIIEKIPGMTLEWLYFEARRDPNFELMHRLIMDRLKREPPTDNNNNS